MFTFSLSQLSSLQERTVRTSQERKKIKKRPRADLVTSDIPIEIDYHTQHVGYKQNYQLPFARSFNSNNPNSKDQISLGVSRCHKRLPLLNCHDK